MAQEDSGIQLLLGLLSATGGALGAIALRELIQWVKRPKLQLTLDLSALKIWNVSELPEMFRHEAKYVRLTVQNNGKTVARHCEAKIEPMDDKGNSLFDPSILHWVRKYPAVYRSPPEQFAPISVNRNDHEFLDVIAVDYYPEGANVPNPSVSTVSHRPFCLQSNSNYRLKVTVFSENANPQTLTLHFSWDGTWGGFDEKCVSSVEE